MIALVARLSGLRAIAERCGHLLGTGTIATLSGAMSRPSSLRFVEKMVRLLETRHTPGPGDLVALDSMAVTLPATQRHRCRKMNADTVGGAVVWAHMVQAPAGTCPVKVLAVRDGAWHDSRVIRTVALEAGGPIHLMDRGFYALDNLQRWVQERVHFIVRARRRSLVFEDLEIRGAPRRTGDVRIEHDALVRLGGPQAKAHPLVRLVVARLASGDDLILASGLRDWSAEDLLAAYQRRWHIERFHRFVKDALGLAHLYSFHRTGLRFLVHVALLVAMLLFLGVDESCGETIATLHRALRRTRAAVGLGSPWRRNTFTKRRSGKKMKGRETGENH